MTMEGGALRRLNERSRDSASVPGSPLHLRVRTSLSQKSFKKVLTPEDEILYHTRTLLKPTGNFTR
jgi:hypothetical protein